MATNRWAAILIVAFSVTPYARSLEAEEPPPPENPRAIELMEQARTFDRLGGSSTDFEHAATLYEEASRLGSSRAKVHLAYLCQQGLGTSKDPGRAIRLLQESAQAGDSEGRFGLGMAYLTGSGVPQDPVGARGWISQAANGGHQLAQLVLGNMLLEGSGGPENEIAAGRWFSKAANGADRELAAKAAKLRDEVIDLANRSTYETELESMLASFVAVWLVTATASAILQEPGARDKGPRPPSGCFDRCMAGNMWSMGYIQASMHCGLVCA